MRQAISLGNFQRRLVRVAHEEVEQEQDAQAERQGHHFAVEFHDAPGNLSPAETPPPPRPSASSSSSRRRRSHARWQIGSSLDILKLLFRCPRHCAKGGSWWRTAPRLLRSDCSGPGGQRRASEGGRGGASVAPTVKFRIPPPPIMPRRNLFPPRPAFLYSRHYRAPSRHRDRGTPSQVNKIGYKEPAQQTSNDRTESGSSGTFKTNVVYSRCKRTQSLFCCFGPTWLSTRM